MITVRWQAMAIASITLASGSTMVLHSKWSRHHASAQFAEILPNDNRAPAGELRDGVLTIGLVAARGIWFPEENDGPGHEVYAFGEDGELRNPGPLVRVPAGTEIRATIRNAIEGASIIVHGLHDRPGSPDTVHVAAGGTRSVRFRVTSPGTYFYWATARGAATVGARFGMESQLNGALIVDPPGTQPTDYVFLIGIEDDSADAAGDRPLRAAVVNGRSWPHMPPLTARAGDAVRMRWINASDRRHPMHLHGSYFRVDSRGDVASDTIYEAPQQRLAATEHMLLGQTMSLTWVPERPGNWLMHCHMAAHIAPALRLGPRRAADGGHARNHALDLMAGLVTGWRVLPDSQAQLASLPRVEPRRLRLLALSVPGRYGLDPALGFVLQTDEVPLRADSVVIPGPPIVLVQNEPVQITVVNRLSQPTSIHWHGIELDSYFDGVSGWSGQPGRIAPQIEPGDSFEVRFTPP